MLQNGKQNSRPWIVTFMKGTLILCFVQGNYKIETLLNFAQLYSKTCRQRPPSSETTFHVRPQFACTNSFSHI